MPDIAIYRICFPFEKGNSCMFLFHLEEGISGRFANHPAPLEPGGKSLLDF
jgi:hypothetical protein